MSPVAPLRFITAPVDPYSKASRGTAHVEFDLAPLGIDYINGVSVAGSRPVMLPPGTEPGQVFILEVASTGGVMLVSEDDDWPSLLEAPRVIVTDDLCVRLLPAREPG